FSRDWSSDVYSSDLFGYSSEELVVILRPMAVDGKEPTGSMGDDTALAVLSSQPRPLYHYFKQRFAEVTNPPIDHLRERLVFSLQIGRASCRDSVMI